uniref:LITAF domain-containing protein n=1 Tax=Pseudonaja textilis TaxID=8673 RepID=A0A670Y929_PSETE
TGWRSCQPWSVFLFSYVASRCCLGCCLIPFMSKCCKDVDHYCPCCRYHIYRYKRI